MKRISQKQLKLVECVMVLGLRKMITDIDPMICSTADQRAEMRKVNRHKNACVDLLSELKLNNLGLSK